MFVVHVLLCAAVANLEFRHAGMFATTTEAARSQDHGLVDSCSSLACYMNMLLSGATCNLTAGYRVPCTHATRWE